MHIINLNNRTSYFIIYLPIKNREYYFISYLNYLMDKNFSLIYLILALNAPDILKIKILTSGFDC